MVIHVRYHESQVWEVITEPSVLAFLPTIMLVQDKRLRPSGVDSSTCATVANADAIRAIETKYFKYISTFVGYWLSFIGYRLSVIVYWLSVIVGK